MSYVVNIFLLFLNKVYIILIRYYTDILFFKTEKTLYNLTPSLISFSVFNKLNLWNEKLYIVIALGYGANQGHSHKSKTLKQVTKGNNHPDWFIKGVEAALKAPTAINQQNFVFSLENDKVIVKPGLGFYSKVDLGIIKYHFEIGSNKKIFKQKRINS